MPRDISKEATLNIPAILGILAEAPDIMELRQIITILPCPNFW